MVEMNLPKKDGIPSTLKVLKGISASRNKELNFPLEEGVLVTLLAFKTLTHYDNAKIKSLMKANYLTEPSKEDIAAKDIISQETIEQRIKRNKKSDEEEVIHFLRSKDLFLKIVKEFDKKIVGEEDTKTAIFLPLCSIYVENIGILPHVFVTGESSGGKSHIASAISKIFPSSRRIWRTKLTPEIFTYWHNSKFEPNWTWDGKILYVEDPKNSFINSDTFRNFLSEGSCSTVVINQVAVDINIKGKPVVILTTAHTNPKLEILNRLNIVAVDESPLQTHQVLQFAAEESAQQRPDYNSLIKKSLEFLKRISVYIPYSKLLVDVFPIKNIRVRRDFKRFLALIKCSVALHQFQRNKDEEGRFLAIGEDYEIARGVFAKMQSNDMMVALNHKQKKAYDVCQKLTAKSGWFAVKDAHAENPALSSLKHWYKLIDDLSRDGLLDAKIDDSVAHSRAPTIYKAVKSGSFMLPSFNFIIGKDGEECETGK